MQALLWPLTEWSIMSDTIRYDTIEEFKVDSKAEYSALSSTRSRKKCKKKKLKLNKRQCPFNSVQVQTL